MNRWLATAFVVCTLAATAPAGAAPPVTVDSTVCFNGQIGDANVASCGRLIASNTLRGVELVRAYRQRAIIFSRRGVDFDRAIADATEILKIDPTHVDALALRGVNLMRRGEAARAREDIAAAERLGPKTQLAFNSLSAYHNLAGDYDRALAAAAASLQLGPNGVYALKNRGESLEHKGELHRALADYRAVLARDPQKTERSGREAAEGIARIERKLTAAGVTPAVSAALAEDTAVCFRGPVGDAHVAACGRLIASSSLNASERLRAHLRRAILYGRRGDNFDRVIADATEILKIEAAHAEALAMRANALMHRGQAARAREDAEAAARLGPKTIVAFNALGNYYNMVGDHDRALAAADEAQRLNPGGLYWEKNRAAAYEGKGEFARALADYRTALARDPQKLERLGRESAEGIARIEQKLAARTAAPPATATQTPAAAAVPLDVVPGRRIALVIGNDRYENLPQLQKAANDARAVAERMERLGFEVIRVENANRRTMSEKLSEMTGKLGRGDTAFFFFAGHGIAIRDTNFLLPVDIPLAREGQEGLVAREAFGADAVLEALQERGARVSLLVLDACRDNPFKGNNSRGVGGSRGLTRMQAPEGVFMLYSAGIGQTAIERLSDSDGDPNSVFTRTFIRQLDRPGITLQELAKTTQSEVKKLAAGAKHVQMPAYYDQIDGSLALARK